MKEFGRAAAIIDISCIANNIKVIRGLVSEKTRIMAVVKANGYGHGIYEVAVEAIGAGANWLGVATAAEGVLLRGRGIVCPILVMGPTFEEEFEGLVVNDLVATVFSIDVAKKLASVAAGLGKAVEVHIKIDTGMNRVGYTNHDDKDIDEIIEISRLDNIILGGAFSHLATSDSDPVFAKEQFARFMHMIDRLSERGLHIPIKHISNSGGIIGFSDFNLDMVRAGVLIYGLAPNSLVSGAYELERLGFLPALTLKSRIAHIKMVKAGESVGYSRNYIAKTNIQVATIPLGYADGISRQLSNRGKVLINGVLCDIIGNVCMDQFMVDATLANARLRDEVVIIGQSVQSSQDGQSSQSRIWAEDVAGWQNSINYEVATSISDRVTRLYSRPF